MKILNSVAALICASISLAAQTYLTDQHVDFGLAYEDGAWDLHVHDETTDIEYAPADAVLVFGENLLTPVPAGAKFSFLGTAGSPVYILPAVPGADRLYLGFGSEELSPADWNGNLSIRLTGISGPGHLFAWDLDAFGNVRVRFNSRDGFGPDDVYEHIPGGHGDLNFAFDQAGEYGVTIEASGGHVVDGLVSGSGTYRVVVGAVPEPGPVTLLMLGVAGVVLAMRRRRSAATLP